MVTLVAVTVLPRSSSRPVPDWRLPNRAVGYQEVCQGVAGSPDSASEALDELSPSEVPLGPNAAALTGFSLVSGIAVGAGPGLAGLEADAEPGLGCGLWDAAGVWAAAWLEDPATGGWESPDPDVSWMATKPIAASQNRYTAGTSHRRRPGRGLRGVRGVRGGCRLSSSSSVTGLPEGCAASYWLTSAWESAPTAEAIARMWPRA